MAQTLVGRDHEVAMVRGIDAGQTVAVVGPAGIGKTALIEEALAERARHVGAGFSLLLSRPYAPLEAAMRTRFVGEPIDVAAEVVRRAEGVLVVEDLHWVHELTVAALHHIAGRVPLVVTTRPEAAAVALHLGTDVCRIDLGPLTPRSADRLARRAHPSMAPDDRRRLLDLAAGTPLLIERLAVDDQVITPTLEAAIAARAARLSPGERRAVAKIAALGRPAEPEVVDPETLPVSNLLVHLADGRTGLQHATIGRAVLCLLDEGERRAVHGELADALGDAEGAAHDLAAGRHRRAATRAMRAVDEADDRSAFRAELLRLAADATERSGDDADGLRVQAAVAFVDAGRWDDAVAEARRVQTDQPPLAAEAALQEGRARWCAGEVDAARAVLAAAADRVADDDPALATRIAVERAHLEVRDRVPGAREVAASAVALASRTGVEVLRARSNLGAAMLYDGAEGWEAHLRSVLHDAADDLEIAATTAYHLVSGYGFVGRFAEALEVASEQIRRTRDVGLHRLTVHFEVAALVHRAQITAEPAVVVVDADRLLDEHPLFRNRFQMHLARHLALLDLGRFDDAADGVAVFDRERRAEPEDTVALAAMQAELAWHVDDVDLGEAALALGREAADAYFGLHLVTERTVADLQLRHHRRCDPRLPSTAMPAWWPALHEIDGLRQLAAGDIAGADVLAAVAEQWMAISTPRWAIRALLTAADHASPRRSGQLRRRAMDLGRRSGCVGSLLARGMPTRPELTTTEETVLRRVRRGDTTRQIAAELAIAPSTVDQHVESARRKLGAATRLEAAAVLDG